MGQLGPGGGGLLRRADNQGVVTDARDAYGTSGQQYVERFQITLAAFGMGQSLDGLGAAGEAPASDAIGVGLANALQQQGVPYVWGGAAPADGFDCSGLVYWAYAQAGVQLPRLSAEQWHWTERVNADEAQPGDLVFFAGTNGPDISHVGIYAGAGLMLNAPDVGQTVTLEPLNDPYWQAHLAGFGRIDPNYTPADNMLPVATDPAPATDPAEAPVGVPAPIESTPTPAPTDPQPQPAPITTPEPTPTQPATEPPASPTPGPATPTATEPPRRPPQRRPRQPRLRQPKRPRTRRSRRRPTCRLRSLRTAPHSHWHACRRTDPPATRRVSAAHMVP